MDPIIGGALIGAGSGLLGDLFNFGQQRANLRYQKGLQREVFAREDTAVQRRVADLRAAGLSPTLAAGSAAASGAAIQTRAPQMPRAGERAREALMGALEMRAMKAGVRKIEAEAGRTIADTRRVEAEAKLSEARSLWSGDLALSERSRAVYEAGTALSENRIRTVAAQLMEEFGYREREALVKAREIETRIKEIQEKFGAGGAASVNQWLPLVELLIDIMGGK